MKNVEVQQKSKELRRFQAKLPCNYAMIETGFQCFKAINTCLFVWFFFCCCFLTAEQKFYFICFLIIPFPHATAASVVPEQKLIIRVQVTSCNDEI